MVTPSCANQTHCVLLKIRGMLRQVPQNHIPARFYAVKHVKVVLASAGVCRHVRSAARRTSKMQARSKSSPKFRFAAVLSMLPLFALVALAQDQAAPAADPPGRVARIAIMQGNVSLEPA